jgi:hypothetical protein
LEHVESAAMKEAMAMRLELALNVGCNVLQDESDDLY